MWCCAGLDLEGIYRIAGNVTVVEQLRRNFVASACASSRDLLVARVGIDTHAGRDDRVIVSNRFLVIDPNIDPHVVAGLLKQYLRELKEPLFTTALMEAFLQIARASQYRRPAGRPAVAASCCCGRCPALGGTHRLMPPRCHGRVRPDDDNQQSRVPRLRALVHQLPDAHFATLRYIVQHLRRCAARLPSRHCSALMPGAGFRRRTTA